MDKEQMLSRWWAACELVRATDAVRELAALGRATQQTFDRLHEAESRWKRVRGC